MLPSLLRHATCATTSTGSLRLAPIRWTYLPTTLQYQQGLLLQEALVQARLDAKAALQSEDTASLSSTTLESLRQTADTDLLLLLQHTPVFTAGKREKDPLQAERERRRLGKIGADYVQTSRGGQTTYHGPGQLVGYPLIDLGAAKLSTRCYVDKLETFLSNLVTSFSVPIHPLSHTGVFVSESSKIASIGVQIRRRITMHGFSINIEEQTRHWFDQIVACGLADVTSTSVEAELRSRQISWTRGAGGGTVKVADAVPKAVELLGEQYGREMRPLEDGDGYSAAQKLVERALAGQLRPSARELRGV